MRRLVGVVLSGAFALPSFAATIHVTTTDDPAASGCGLRDAIVAANTDAPSGGCPAGDGADVIDLLGVTGAIHLGLGPTPTEPPPISDAVTLSGPGADLLAIHGDGAVRPLVVATFAGVAVQKVAFVDGASSSSATDPGYGGCILAYGPLALSYARLTGCSGEGALYVMMGLTTLERVLVDANEGAGLSVGGITGAGGIVIQNSTVSGNGGTGLELRNFDGPGPSAFVYGSTFADNGGANVFVPVYSGDPNEFPLHLDHVVLANEAPSTNCGGQPIVSDGFNLADDASCAFDEASDLANVDAKIGPLAANGGATATHLPLPGSPAIDSGSFYCPGFQGVQRVLDQRGSPRPADGDGDGQAPCDRGALELPEPGAAPVAALLALAALRRRWR
jgi:hypothetical protein